MKHYAIFFLGTLVFFLFLLLPAFSQEDMEVVDNGSFEPRQRPPVIFPHDEHNENAGIDECNECHHVYSNGNKVEDESSEDQSCAECHELKDVQQVPSLRKAFHRNCKGCHLEQQAGPLMCGRCHVR